MEDRIIEYKNVIMEAGDYPEELEHTTRRLKKRIRKGHLKRALTGLGVLAGAIILLTSAVNTSTVIAETIEQIPVIGDLAQFLRFDKGLQNAAMNQYVQELNLEQESNGYTLGLPYVIADSKRLVLFFKMPESLIDQELGYQVIIDDSYCDNLSIRSINYPGHNGEFGFHKGLQAISIRYDGADVPQDLQIPVSLVKLYRSDYPIEESLIYEEEGEPAVLGSYEFTLHLKDFPEPVTTILNEEMLVSDQTVLLQSISEYPTGVEIRAKASNNGDTIISGLKFQGIDKYGNRWEAPEGMYPAVTYGDPEIEFIYYLENDYYNESFLTGLEITGVGMFRKEDQKITIDLLNKTISPVIPDLIIRNIIKKEDKAIITFEATVEDASMSETMGTFHSRYEDLQGNIYYMGNEYGRQFDKVQTMISVIWPEDNQVVLSRMKAPVVKLDNPVWISLHK